MKFLRIYGRIMETLHAHHRIKGSLYISGRKNACIFLDERTPAYLWMKERLRPKTGPQALSIPSFIQAFIPYITKMNHINDETQLSC